jgi:hypothetical protein
VSVFDGPHEITDGVDAVGDNLRHLKANELIFNGDDYLKAIKPVRPEIVAKVRLVSDLLWIDVEMSRNDFANPDVDIPLHDRASFTGRKRISEMQQS